MRRNTQKNHTNIFSATLIFTFLLSCLSGLPAYAQQPSVLPGEQEELLLYFSKDEIIATATKQALPISKVPAVATVITAEQIRNMGARTLFEALKIVPGLGIYQEYAFPGAIEVRGIKTSHSEKVLILLDGIRLNNQLQGSATHLYSDIPLDNVKRIEVVRGPVSALYGANAFVGVINIITKEGGEINGVDMRAGGGSWSTQRYNLLAGKKYGDLQVAAQINYLETDGFRGDVQQDADPFPSSMAPGKTDNWKRRLDVGLTTSWKGLRLEYRHTDRHFGPYIGAVSALNDDSHIHFSEDIGEASYRRTLIKGLDISARVYGSLFKADTYWELYSENFLLGAFPNGALGNPRVKDRTYGGELQVDYQPFKGNLLTVGLNLDRIKQYDVQHWANFNPTSGAPLAGGFQNITDTLNWNRNVHRNVFAWYLQDSWNIADKLNLIAGVRHDQYSDFGNTTNPRAGLVWEFLKDTHLKVMAGRAFRAPNFEELYNDNNPAAMGNPDLDPERITTTEISVETKIKAATLKTAYFKNYINNTIRLVSGQHQNTGRDRYAGLEFEARYDFSKTSNTYANLTWLEPKRLGSGGEITDIPKWRSNIGGNVAFARYFNFNANVFISGDRPRAAGDWRKDIPSYAIIDTALTFKNFWKGLEIQLLAKNLLDKRYDDPAPVTTVPGDYPREGREIFLEARYTF